MEDGNALETRLRNQGGLVQPLVTPQRGVPASGNQEPPVEALANLSLTLLPRREKFQALFAMGNLHEFRTNPISQFPSQRLAGIRYKQLRELLKIPPGDNLDSQEEEFIDQIISALDELILYLSSSELDWKKHSDLIQRICNRIFEAVYRYIHFRAEGIQEHLSIEGVASSYKQTANASPIHYYRLNGLRIINQTFSEYRAERAQEIEGYFKRIEIRRIVLVLRKYAPNLFYERRTVSELFAGYHNSYDDTGSTLGDPPLLGGLSSLLASLDAILSAHFVNAAVLKNLSDQLALLTRVRVLSTVSALIYPIYGSLEGVVCLPEIYFPPEPSFQKECYLSLYLSFGGALSKTISYDLLSVEPGEIERARRTLALKETSLREKVEAKRKLVYAAMPWQTFRNITLILFNVKRLKRPQDESIMLDGLGELKAECERLLPSLRALIEFEIMVARGESDGFDHQSISPPSALEALNLDALKVLGQYGSDVAFLHKLIEFLDSLDYSKSFLPDVMFRIFGVLGECAKNFSQKTRSLMSEPFWHSIAKMRDKITHVSGILSRMEKILHESPELVEAIKADLHWVNEAAKSVLEQLPKNWRDLKLFYQSRSNQEVYIPEGGESFVRLLDCVDSPLTLEDRKELFSTFEKRGVKFEILCDRILAVIEGRQAASSVEQKCFSEWVEGLSPLTKNQRRILMETYKKLRQGKEATIPEDLRGLLKSIKTGDEATSQKKLKFLVYRLRSFRGFEDLKRELYQCNLLPSAIAVWEAKYKKAFARGTQNLVEREGPDRSDDIGSKKIEEIIGNSIKAAFGLLKCLERLAEITRDYRADPNILSSDVMLCYAIDHNLVRVRVYIDAIKEALANLRCYNILDARTLALNELYRILSLKLNQMRSYGNSLAHLHDVSEFNSLTMHGWRLTTFNNLIGIIDGISYGGKQDKPAKHLPSLYEEIRFYTETLIRSTSPLETFEPTKRGGTVFLSISSDRRSGALRQRSSEPQENVRETVASNPQPKAGVSANEPGKENLRGSSERHAL